MSAIDFASMQAVNIFFCGGGGGCVTDKYLSLGIGLKIKFIIKKRKEQKKKKERVSLEIQVDQ